MCNSDIQNATFSILPYVLKDKQGDFRVSVDMGLMEQGVEHGSAGIGLGAFRCNWVKIPAFERVAREGSPILIRVYRVKKNADLLIEENLTIDEVVTLYHTTCLACFAIEYN